MWTSDSDTELTAAAAAAGAASPSSPSATAASASPPPTPPPARHLRQRNNRRRRKSSSALATVAPVANEPEPEAAEDVWRGAQWEAAWPAARRDARKPVVVVAADDGGGAVGRSRSLTDDDLEELRGCADLGFGFSYDEIPELRGTLPALELCYSMTHRLHLDDDAPSHPQQQHTATPSAAAPDASSPPPPPAVTNWKISSPGDSPDEVKARLKYWAQAVACTVRLCS